MKSSVHQESLERVAQKIQASYDATKANTYSADAAEFAANLALLDPEMIQSYAEAYLTDKSYLEKTYPDLKSIKGAFQTEQDREDLRLWLNENPAVTHAAHAATEIMQRYFKDMQDFSRGRYDAAATACSSCLNEVGNGTMWKELLPRIVNTLSEDEKNNLSGKDITKGLQATFKSGAFELQGKTCPFKQRMHHIFKLKPERDPETGEVTISENESGAFLAFIIDEVQQAMGAKADADAVLENTEAVPA